MGIQVGIRYLAEVVGRDEYSRQRGDIDGLGDHIA